MSNSRSEDYYEKMAEKMVESVRGQKTKAKINKKHIERYLYTFANEIGCDFPTEDITRGLLALLI